MACCANSPKCWVLLQPLLLWLPVVLRLSPPALSEQPPTGPAPLLPLCSDAGAAYGQVHDTLQRVLQMYIFHLIDTGECALAVPATPMHPLL